MVSSRPPRRTYLAVLNRGHQTLLTGGEILVGRSPGCQIVLTNSLVSRFHARIQVTSDEVVVVDLGSANGVYVNEQRIEEPTPLKDGDRILIGTEELSVFEAVADTDLPIAPPGMDVEVREVEDTQPEGVPPVVEVPRVEVSSTSLIDEDVMTPTEKVHGIIQLGRLSDRLLAVGRTDAAVRLMSLQMGDLLSGVRGGAPIPDEVLDAAARYALKLAEATENGSWVDYSVELHMVLRRPMKATVLDRVEKLIANVPTVSRSLFIFYQQALRAEMPRMSPQDRVLSERILQLEPPKEG